MKIEGSQLRANACLLAGLALALTALAPRAFAANHDAEFESAVHGVAAALHSHPRHRRLLGAAELLVRGAEPIGSKDVHVALFDLDREPTDAEREGVGAALQAALPAPWQLIARDSARYGDRESWVYARPEGSRLETVVCLLERGQATLVMAQADPEAMLNSLQEPGMIVWTKDVSVRGLWSGLGDGSGFGPGIAFETPANEINLAQLHGSAQVTYEGYFESFLGFRFDPTGGDMRTFSLDLTGRYRLHPEEDFFGQGPLSPAQRTMYDWQERGLALTFGIRPARTVQLGVGEDYSGNRVFGGRDAQYANAQTAFSPQLVPGLARGANLLSTFAFFQFDGRDYPRNPHRGAYLRLAAADSDGTGHSGFGFWNYQADARAYLPLTHASDVLAGRVLGIWNRPKPGEEVPFFRLARLGDSSTLRGYRPYRFYGLNAVTSSLEYRHYFDESFGAFVFGDIGQVYDRRSELTRANMRTTWGAGLLFNDGRRKTSFKLFFGSTSDEGHRWFLTLGPTF